jgi:2'-5' RNA ligase
MKTTIRTFVAVEIGEAIRRAAAGLVEQLRTASADVTWVAPHNMHLTVKFLGDVAAERIPQVSATVAEAVADVRAFDLEVRGLGAFPNVSRPRTIWIGTGTGEAELAMVAERLETSLAKLGFAREGRPFRGHLTVGRVRRPSPALAAVSQILREQGDLEFGRTTIREVVVFSSQLERGGPIYEAMSRAPLAK